MTDKTNQGLSHLMDALQEASSIENQYCLHQYVGSSIDDLIDVVNGALNSSDQEEAGVI